MPLPPGSRLGAYEVVGLLGAGGMGEVYRARDSKLKRDVALKVLPAEVATDCERLARFQREAEVLASLNHPHIAQIHGLEESGGTTALVMELVDGEDLLQRIARGPLPLDEALPIATQIAEALEAAHEQGIIHRDLKPANVKVRPDGTVKVLDFGLAKAMEQGSGIGDQGSGSALANSPTITSPAMTMRGVILGTAAYMSPEQAKGKPVDRRTDIFAFGCVLFEMITGRRAFDGEDVTDVLGAVVRLEPDWSRLPGDCPPAIHRLLRLCLEKNIRNRRSAATDVRLDLEEVRKAAPPAPAGPVRGTRLAWIAAALLLVATIALSIPYLRPEDSPIVTRFQIEPPPGTVLAPAHVAASPDGRLVVFAAAAPARENQLFVRSLETGDTHALPGTDGAASPFWSPDSRFVAFASAGSLKRIDVSGGPAQTLCNAHGPGLSGTWNADGVIVFSSLGGGGGLYRVSAEGGTPEPLTTPDASRGERLHASPYFLTDGTRFLFSVRADTADGGGTYVGSVDGSPPVRILASSQQAQFAPSGQLVFVRNDVLFAQSFDPRSLRLSGEPTRVAESVAGAPMVGRAGFSVAGNGVLVVVPGQGITGLYDLSWYDRTGKPLTHVGLANYRGLDLSPDGKRLAAHRHDDAAGGGDLWISDLERGTERRFTFEPTHHASSPVWSPDGASIVFGALRGGKWGIYRKPSDGSGADELLFESDQPKVPMAWSPDGKTVVFVNYDPKTLADLWILPMSGDRVPTPYLQSDTPESHPQISPDGHWMLYLRRGTWVQSFPVPGTIYQVSSSAGGQARWRADGKEILLATDGVESQIVSIPVSYEGSALTFGAPKALFSSRWSNPPHVHSAANINYFTFAISPDGQRFLVPRQPGSATADEPRQPITVILNWMSLLDRKSAP